MDTTLYKRLHGALVNIAREEFESTLDEAIEGAIIDLVADIEGRAIGSAILEAVGYEDCNQDALDFIQENDRTALEEHLIPVARQWLQEHGYIETQGEEDPHYPLMRKAT